MEIFNDCWITEQLNIFCNFCIASKNLGMKGMSASSKKFV